MLQEPPVCTADADRDRFDQQIAIARRRFGYVFNIDEAVSPHGDGTHRSLPFLESFDPAISRVPRCCSHWNAWPPLMLTISPVTNPAPGEHSHTTADATSAGRPGRLTGKDETTASCCFKLVCSSWKGVSRINPGATALTVIERGASSLARPRVSPKRPAFAAAYAALPAPPPLNPARDATFTTRPASASNRLLARQQ